MTMNTYRNYKHLSQQIHAPEALKNRVMTIAAQENLTKQNQPASRRHQSFGFFQKAAVAALLAIVLPVTAFAAAKKMGLLEYLSLAGIQDTPAIEALSYNVMEKQAYRNNYAEYTVVEAVCDDQVLYIAAEITPLDESTLLVPQFVMEEESASIMKIDGAEHVTVGEYAAAQGKSLVYADIGYWNGDAHIDGSVDFRCDPDGTLHYFYSAVNTFQTRQLTLSCAGVAYTDGMSVADRVEFDVALFDRSRTHEEAYTVFDPVIATETGIQITELVLQETELGLYATLTFTAENDEAWRDCLSFALVDEAGAQLLSMPNIGYGITDNGNGTYSTTLAYQRPNAASTLQIMIQNYVNDCEYGPYSFG